MCRVCAAEWVIIMKKWSCAILAGLLIFSLAACGKTTPPDSAPASGDPSASAESLSSGEASEPEDVSGSPQESGTDSTTNNGVLKPIKTTGNQNKTSGKTGSVTKWTGSKETVPSNVDLSTPQEKMLASVKGTTITIVDDEVTDNGNTKVFRQIVQEKYGLKLKFISIKDGVAGQNQFAQMVAAGNPPDVFSVDEVTFLRYVCSNIAQPLDPYLAKSDPFWKEVDLSDYYFNNKTYGIPATWGLRVYMCVYNKTLFKEQKQKTPTELYKEGNWNFKTFLDAAKKMTIYRADGKTVQTYGVGTWNYALFMFANGGKGLSEKNGKLYASVDQKPEMGGLQLLHDLVAANAFYTGDSYIGFGRRRVAMHLEQPANAVGNYDYYNNMEDEIGIVPLPMANDGKYYAPKSAGGMIVPRNAKNPLGAVAFAYEMAKFDNNRFFNSTLDFDLMYRRMSISDEDLALYLDYRKKAVPLMSYMESLSGWWDGGYRDKFWNTIVVDKKKPAEAVASMKSVLESCISRTTS